MVARRVALSFLCILVGYSIFGIYAFSLRFQFGFPVEAYWLSFVFISIPLLCEVAFWKSSPKLRLLFLLSFSLMIHLQFAVVDSSPLLSSEDAIADFRLTDKIVADSQWTPFGSVEWGFGYEYRFYPVTNFLYATMSLLTGMPLLIVVKYLFVIKAFVVTPIVERLFRGFFNQRIAYLATAVFLVSPGAILFPHKESFAVIFFFLGLYASIKTEKTRQFVLIGLISILTLVMTHHFTTYVFLILLTSLFVASHFYERQKAVRVSSQFYMLCLIAFATWVTFIAWTIVASHQKLLLGVFFQTLLPGELTFTELLPLYSSYERIIILLGYGITIFSAGLGFLGYMRNRKDVSSSFLAMMSVLIPTLAVASIFRFLPLGYRGIILSHRAYEFGYIAIGAFSGLFFIRAIQSRKKATLKLILIAGIVFILMTGPMAGAMHPRTFVRVSGVVSVKATSMNTWMSESGASNEYAVGDQVLYLILAGYGNSSAFSYPELFRNQDFGLPSNIRSESSYVVTYIYMTDFYGPEAAKFYDSPYFHSSYANGMLNVFSIANRTSS